MGRAGTIGKHLKHRWSNLGFRRKDAKSDILAGLTGAIGSISDGMAAGILAGVSPIHGLYASMIAPLVGGLTASSAFMTITTTSAMALTAGDVVRERGGDPVQVLLLLTLLIGGFQIAAGLARLGGLTRFVSRSVMVGFLTGVAVLLILGQLGTFTGFESDESNNVLEAWDLITNLGSIQLQTLAIGCLTLGLAILLARTKLKAFGALIALVVTAVLVQLLGWESVSTVSDIAEIPGSLPIPELPALSGLSLDLITSAMAIAAIGLVQGAGVSQNFPNPGGEYANASRDFTAQGAANVAASLVRGMPVGGSVGQTALNVSAGARTRWANIFAGLWIAVVILLLSRAVGYVPMPALAALLILAGYQIIDAPEAVSIGQVGWSPRFVIVLTFVATLILPIQAAVGLGVLASAILYLYASSTDIAVVEIVPLDDGGFEERDPPELLTSDQVTLLDVYGSLYFAGARTFEQLLPSPADAHHAVVILRLRGRTKVGATFVDVMARYAERLALNGGRLYLSGVGDHVQEQLVRTGKLVAEQRVGIFAATTRVGESSRLAHDDAEEWLRVVGLPEPDAPSATAAR